MRKQYVIWGVALLVLFLIKAGDCAGAEQPGPGQWLLVTAPAFRKELTPLIEQRRTEGFKVTILETTNVLTVEQIQQGDGLPLQTYLEAHCGRSNGPNYLLLAGVTGISGLTNDEQITVPALRGAIGRMKGKPDDYGYSLPDKDGLPALAVGRFPARTAAEVRGMVAKTLNVELDQQPGSWRNRLVLLTGDTGGGPMADMMVEPALAARLERLDPAWNVHGIMSTSGSRYYLPAGPAHDAALQALAEGQLISVFMGHSSAGGMWLTGNHFITRQDWGNVKIPRGPGIFFTCGCFACQLRGRDGEGYGLTAIRNAGGPAAVIGASGESWAAPGQLAMDGLLRCCAKPPFPTRLADYWLSVQAGLARGEIEEVMFKLFDQFDGSQGRVSLPVQRREHLEMWMLLGDPALHLPLVPSDISMEVPATISPGGSLTVKGSVPANLAGAVVRVTLERPINSLPAGLEKPPAASAENRADRERVAIENCERANKFVLASVEARLDGNKFACTVAAPAQLPWAKLIVRASAAGQAGAACGVAALPVNQQ
jgi:hypothetical protein